MRTPEGERAVFKTARKPYTDSEERRPLTIAERVAFVEERIRKCNAHTVGSYEQNLAASYRGSIVSSHILGKMLCRLGHGDMAHIRNEQLLQAALDLEAMAESGVLHDTNGTNSVYHPQEGFGFFDAHDNVENTLPWRLKRNLEGFAANLATEGRVMRDGTKRQKLIGARTDLFWRLRALGDHPALSEQTATLVRNLDYMGYWNKPSSLDHL